MFIRPVESTIGLEAKGCILLINELFRLGKAILICLINDIYFTHVVAFIRKLWEVSSVIGTEMSTGITIPGSVCPFCLSPWWSEKAPNSS